MIIKNGKRMDGLDIDTLPIGTIQPYIASTAPVGYLICDGTKVLKSRYPDLYLICQDHFGTSTDTKFYLPNLKGKSIIGYNPNDSDFNTLYGLVGSKAHTHITGDHTLTVAEMPSHYHINNPNGFVCNTLASGGPGLWSGNSGNNLATSQGTSATGGGGAHNHGSTGSSSNIEPSIILNWIVKAEKVVSVAGHIYNDNASSLVDTYSCSYINSNQGNMAELTTTEKTNLVGAINEVDNNSHTGWMSSGEIWTYSSVDNPTGVITISGDKTGKYSLGMKIKFTNNSNIIYGIITAISYTSPNTTLTFLHEINPSNSQALHIMANSAITDNYYSSMKAPYGFPINQDSWSIIIKHTVDGRQLSPAQNTWYNLGGTSEQISIPIGSWSVEYLSTIGCNAGSVTEWGLQTALSISNSSISDNDFASYIYIKGLQISAQTVCRRKNISLTAKTLYYLIIRTLQSGINNISTNGSMSSTIIRATCVYL